MKFKHVLAAFVATVSIFGFTACEVPEDEGTAADRIDTEGAANDKTKEKVETAADEKPAKEDKGPKETPAQANAREAAESYLDMAPFSRSGLIEQLEFEGYKTKDATYGVDAQKADWNQQAAAAAKQYLDMSSFSRQSLIEQLVFEGYTQKQATYGVNKVGL